MSQPEKDRLLSVTEAAGRLGCSRAHIYDLVAAGRLRRFNISLVNSKVRISELDLERYIRESEEPVGGAA